jgi:hypothetical protein
MAKKFNKEKFEKAGWLLTEETAKSQYSPTVVTTYYYQSPRMPERTRSWLSWDDPDLTDDYLIGCEWDYFFNETYHMAINEIADLIRENMRENYGPLTV